MEEEGVADDMVCVYLYNCCIIRKRSSTLCHLSQTPSVLDANPEGYERRDLSFNPVRQPK